MTNSKQVGGLVGPTLLAMLIAEFPLVQPHLYDAQIPPVVYLSGVLMFVAGLAVVRAHNLWARNWTILVTLSGWSLLVLGLVRMFAASQYRQVAQATSSMTFMVVEGLLLAVGLTITINAYSRSNP
jgi:energy-converting hydrogenase Eha subunit C